MSTGVVPWEKGSTFVCLLLYYNIYLRGRKITYVMSINTIYNYIFHTARDKMLTFHKKFA